MVGPDNGEVPSIHGGNLGNTQAFGGGHNGRIHGSQRQVTVASNQLSDTQPVPGHHGGNRESTTGQVPEEADLRAGAEPGRQQVDHLGDHQGRDDERAGMGLEKLQRSQMVRVVSVDVGVEGPGVDNNSDYRPTSVARISSMRSETSLLPLRPAPAAPSRRRPGGPPR